MSDGDGVHTERTGGAVQGSADLDHEDLQQTRSIEHIEAEYTDAEYPEYRDASLTEELTEAEYTDAELNEAELTEELTAAEDAEEVEAAATGKHRGAARVPRTRGDLVRTGFRGLGQTLVTLGLTVLLFVAYELWVTDFMTNERQEDLTAELRENWEVDDPTVAGPELPGGGLSDIPLGQGFAFIRIPDFGADFVKVVIEGTDAEELEQGPGHYVDTALPGEVGNFAVAGHRVGKGSPFLDLDRLQPGDAIVIETAQMWFTYRVLGDPASGDYESDPSGIPGMQIVSPADIEVINPIPGVTDSAVAPSAAYLTLTTCHPKFSAQQRLIVHALLDGPGLPRSEYPDGPPAMTEA